MALSNWDTLAVNELGEPIRGAYKSPHGVTVEFYKNWLYVRDEAAFQPGDFDGNVVMEVQQGEVRYRDVRIVAWRGPQEGVFAVVYATSYPDWDEQGPLPKGVTTGMVGCGVYGYADRDWVGVRPETVDWFRSVLNGAVAVPQHPVRIAGKLLVWNGDNYVPSDVPIDVPEQILDVPEVFRRLPDDVIRYNQGDAYFADRLDGLDLPASAPGMVNEPIMMQGLGPAPGEAASDTTEPEVE